MYNAPFLVLQNTESCVSRRNNETHYAGFVACFSVIHDIWSLFPIFFLFFFFSFSNCLDRCSTLRDFARPHPPFVFLLNFPVHRTTIDSKEKNTGKVVFFPFYKFSFSKLSRSNFSSKSKRKRKHPQTIDLLIHNYPYFSNISWNLGEKRKERRGERGRAFVKVQVVDPKRDRGYKIGHVSI